MQAVFPKRPVRTAMIAALVLALAAVLTFALLSAGTRTAQAAVRHATHHPAHHARHHARSASDPAGTTDPDNLQSGDQTSPDNAPGATAGEGESNVEPELGQQGEPANGHQDAAGNADHQCDGNCVE